MKLNSISGLVFYVADLEKTAKFYEFLGMRMGKRDDTSLTVYVNWFSIVFVAAGREEKSEFQKEATAKDKGQGVFVNIKVENADEAYEDLVKGGYIPSSIKPHDRPWGNREFVMLDPDGYKLVFFQKLK